MRVARTWDEAARNAGVQANDPMPGGTPLTQMPGFEAYQAEKIGWNEFLQRVRLYLSLDSCEDAERVHHGILMEPFDGTDDLVEELHQRGVRTACLSNTNAAHWGYLRDPGHYPAIAALEMPVASHEVGLGKPDPAIYAEFEALTGHRGNEILFFDDNAPNVEAARAFGWHAYLINPAGDTAAQMREILAPALAA